MPAQNRRLSKYKRKKKKRLNLRIPIIILLVGLLFLAYLYKSSHFWNGKNKTVMVINKEDGAVRISIFDPRVYEIVNLDIPANAEVEVARKLGRMQIKNVWQLGANEGLDGKLLAETITHHFKFPVGVWADSKAHGLSEGKIDSAVNAVLLPYKTNLGLGDKVRIAIFSIGVKNINRIEIDLTETSYLKKTVLTSGEEGYILSGSFPERLLVFFVDNQISDLGATVLINDATASPEIAEELGQIIEVLGAKIASIDIHDEEDIDCDVGGKNPAVVDKVAELFSCTKLNEPTTGSFDLEITVGKKFARRF